MDALEATKRTLGFLNGNAMEAINKYRDIKEATFVLAKAKCDSLRAVTDAAWGKFTLTQQSCSILSKTVGGFSSPVYNLCHKKASLLGIAYRAADQNANGCGIAANVEAIYSASNKFTLWVAHYVFKVA